MIHYVRLLTFMLPILLCLSNLESSGQSKLFVGGEMNFDLYDIGNGDDSEFLFFVKPTVGLKLNENWFIGMNLLYDKESVLKTYGIGSFGRYRKPLKHDLGLFTEISLMYSNSKPEYVSQFSEEWSINRFTQTASIGLDYTISPRWMLMVKWDLAFYL